MCSDSLRWTASQNGHSHQQTQPVPIVWDTPQKLDRCCLLALAIGSPLVCHCPKCSTCNKQLFAEEFERWGCVNVMFTTCFCWSHVVKQSAIAGVLKHMRLISVFSSLSDRKKIIMYPKMFCVYSFNKQYSYLSSRTLPEYENHVWHRRQTLMAMHQPTDQIKASLGVSDWVSIMLTHAVRALQETEGGRETHLTSIWSLMKLPVEFSLSLCPSLSAPPATPARRPFDASLPVVCICFELWCIRPPFSIS